MENIYDRKRNLNLVDNLFIIIVDMLKDKW